MQQAHEFTYDDHLEFVLRSSDLDKWEGVYIPSSIPPEDLQLLDVQLPLQTTLGGESMDPSKSMFFYTPDGLYRG